MKIKAQMAMVLNLDKCLGCHTCSIPCKNAWTTAPGSEYMWFNNVETKPGTGYPHLWENQHLRKGGWVSRGGKLHLKAGGKWAKATQIFGNPNLPTMDHYYEPWNYDYAHLTHSPKQKHQPAARAYSSVTGLPMTPQRGPNWDGDLAGTNVTGLDDPNFEGMDAHALLQFQRVFMMHLPRLCEHCLNPACVASCPSGAMYKRDEDGIVLSDQTRCRSWRFCMSGCPYKKVYFNWKTHHSQKCLFCYPRIEAGLPTLCAHSCTGRIRYVGIMLYDADAVHDLAATPNDADVYEAQLRVFLNPHDPEVIKQASKDGITHPFLTAAQRSPVYTLISEWKLALPLHPEFRTLPMVWYIPPASPQTTEHTDEAGGEARGEAGAEEGADDAAKLDTMRIPVRYLANLFTAGQEAPVRASLHKLLALRRHMRHKTFGDAQGNKDSAASAAQNLAAAGMTPDQADAMYRLLAIARYNDRFVIPTARREHATGESVEALKGHTGYPERGPVAPDFDGEHA